MKLIQCHFSSGPRVPLLVQAGHAAPLPILIPFIYVQLKLRHRAYNTAAAHCNGTFSSAISSMFVPTTLVTAA